MRIIFSGGLGNQMFQYALYLALKEKGRNVKMNTSLYSQVEMHNGYELDRCFDVNVPVVKSGKVYLFFLRLLLKIKPGIVLYSDHFCYDEKIFATKHKYLNGYWQSEKYFKQIENLIREVFVFQNIDVNNEVLAKEISSNNSISLHLRRGDYLGNSIYSGVCTEEYYINAVKQIMLNITFKQVVKFYVFSDDKNFAKQFISKLNLPAKLIDYNQGADSYKDMYLMSQCKHNIIANSSFSWWGAWLNSNPDKIVVAPRKWFNVGNVAIYNDIVPENWIKI